MNTSMCCYITKVTVSQESIQLIEQEKKIGHPYIGENETLKRQRPLTEKEKIDKYKFEFIKIKFLPIKVFFHIENGKEVKIGRSYLQDIILTKG